MGGGTTTIAVFFDGNLSSPTRVPVGGEHVTNDIARGLSTPLAHAERMKTLYGSAIASTADEREMIAVPQIGEEEDGHANHVPKSLLVGIIAPRIEETFELVRNRLEASGFDKVAGRRVVLTGGACQLHGRARARRRSSSTSRSASAGRCASRDWPRRPAGRPSRPPPGCCISPCPSAPRRRAHGARRPRRFGQLGLDWDNFSAIWLCGNGYRPSKRELSEIAGGATSAVAQRRAEPTPSRSQPRQRGGA